jgi:single-strand DNA-binding protein
MRPADGRAKTIAEEQMAGSLNKVMLIGRLGRDPELKYTPSGAPVVNFTMATDESFNDREGNKVERTEWHRIVVFGRQAETVANYLGKGSLVYVEGGLQTRKWQDQNGQDRWSTEIKALRVQFLEPRGAQQGQGAQQGAYNRQAPPQQQGGGGGGGYPEDEDMGPAFPSEASGMDDVPF